ncbi:MAG: hypothetical protein DLM64_09105 [Solirubrobacterales bacterium]|nr:MAG: hypothetical protein DLM64_09105 [Solirubrobacterales bacterium]
MAGTAIVGIAFFGLCGLAPAHALARGDLAAHRALLVLPLGATVSSLALTVLGLLHVPLKVSLAVVLAAAAGSTARVAWSARIAWSEPAVRHGAGQRVLLRAGLPLFLAAIVAAISLIPIFRGGVVTVEGQNPDAILVIGSAKLLERAPPTATRPDLPVSHVPLEWRSKYPIYYALAAISTLAGQDPLRTFGPVTALVLALGALGVFLFARVALRAPPWLALLALLLVPLDRIVLYVTLHPFYNELWAQFLLPMMLLTGWRYVRAPDRRSAILFALFVVVGLAVYPLLIPFPAIFLLAGGLTVHRRRQAAGERTGWISALRMPNLRRRPWIWVPLAVVAVPAVVVLGRGFFEKTLSALSVIAPWTSLAGWHAPGLAYIPGPLFFGLPGSTTIDYLGLAVVCALAWRGLARLPADVRGAMRWMVVVTALIGIYFRLRTDGQLFYFRDLAFLGPFVLLLALIELGALAATVARPRAPARARAPAARASAAIGLGGLALALVVVPAGAGREVNGTYPQAAPTVLATLGWDRELPRGTSIRIDVPAGAYQFWCTYFLDDDHPLSALDPLGGPFPHPPVGRKADYVLAQRTQPRPADALGQPILTNVQFELWRMNPAVPGPDLSRRALITDITKITLG